MSVPGKPRNRREDLTMRCSLLTIRCLAENLPVKQRIVDSEQ